METYTNMSENYKSQSRINRKAKSLTFFNSNTDSTWMSLPNSGSCKTFRLTLALAVPVGSYNVKHCNCIFMYFTSHMKECILLERWLP